MIKYKKPKNQEITGLPKGKSVCVVTYPDMLENDIKRYLNLGYQVITTTNNRINTMVYMEKIP